MKRILAIDQGSTATKSYTLDTDGHFIFCGSVEHRQIYPQPGWVEHDPEILLSNVKKSIETATDFEAVGLDNQGETVIVWDADSGLPPLPTFHINMYLAPSKPSPIARELPFWR